MLDYGYNAHLAVRCVFAHCVPLEMSSFAGAQGVQKRCNAKQYNDRMFDLITFTSFSPVR